MTRDEALALGRPLGGQAIKNKIPPETCLRCGEPMAGRAWHSYLGHLGLHGLARQDPTPWNGAWPKYSPVAGQTKWPVEAKGD